MKSPRLHQWKWTNRAVSTDPWLGVKGPQLWSPLQHLCTIPICHFGLQEIWSHTHTVDSFRNPNNHLLHVWNPENNGIYYLPISTGKRRDFFHQPYPLRKASWVSRISGLNGVRGEDVPANSDNVAVPRWTRRPSKSLRAKWAVTSVFLWRMIPPSYISGI